MLWEFDKEWFLKWNFDGGEMADQMFWLASGKLTWVPLYLLIIFLIWRRFGWKNTLVAVVLMGLMVVAADQIANIFKTYTPKFRPSHTKEIQGMVHTVRGYAGGPFGTVSAHAATTFAIALFASRVVRERWLTALVFMWAAAVAYSRIYLGVHFPMDIIFGWVDGAVVAVAALKIFHNIAGKVENKTT